MPYIADHPNLLEGNLWAVDRTELWFLLGSWEVFYLFFPSVLQSNGFIQKGYCVV